jgi:hypothetical protein
MQKSIIKLLLAVFCALPIPSSAGNPGEDTIQMFLAAKRLTERYVNPLHLEGKSVRVAIGAMVDEGFRCGIDVAPGLAPTVECVKHFEDPGDQCDLLVEDFWATWKGSGQTERQLLQEFDSAKITHSNNGMCPVPVTLFPEFESNRPAAETALTHYVSTLQLSGSSSESAYETLIGEGFDCGLDLGADRPLVTEPMTIVCTRFPSRTEHSAQEQVTFSASPEIRDHPHNNHLLQHLGASKISGLSSKCSSPFSPESQGGLRAELLLPADRSAITR